MEDQAQSAKAELESKLAEAQKRVAPAQDALAKLESAVKSSYGKVPVSEFVALDGQRAAAAKAVESAAADVSKLQRGVTAIEEHAAYERGVKEWGTKMEPAYKASEPVRAAQHTLVTNEKAKRVFAECNVTEVRTVSKNVGGEVLTTTELLGPDVPKRPKERKGGSRKGNGGFSARLWQTPSGPLNQSDVFKAYAIEAGVTQERFDQVIADPSNQGISHRGKAVAQKLGFEEVPSA